MARTWTRAWLATVVVLIGAAAIVRNRNATLLRVEEPVMEWLLDGTDTSGWARFSWLGGDALTFGGLVVLALVALWFNRRAAIALIGSMIFGLAVAWLVRDLVARERPVAAESTSGSFPSIDLVQTGVFWGLLVLVIWWLGAPRIVWQIVSEVGIVATILVAIGPLVRGEHWPSDVVGSAIVIGLTLIGAVVLLEDNPPLRGFPRPWAQRDRRMSSAPSA